MKHWITLVFAVFAMACYGTPSSASDTKKPSNERLLIIHVAPSSKANDAEQESRVNVYEGLVEYLTDKGYRVVDKASAEQCSLQIAATHEIDPVLNKAASFGLKFFAEYTIFFKTTTTKRDAEESKGALIRVSAKVVDNTSAQIITSKVADASSSGITLEDAIDKASRAAGKKLAAALIGAMEKFYREAVNAGHIYTIVVESPNSEESLMPLLAQLEGNTSVSTAKETESGGGKATFEICYKGKRDQLDRDILKAAGELGWKLNKVRSEGNRSSWKIK
ncbi:MAG: hypothetical protein WCI45_06475 [Desulfuromonadales bacterium]